MLCGQKCRRRCFETNEIQRRTAARASVEGCRHILHFISAVLWLRVWSCARHVLALQNGVSKNNLFSNPETLQRASATEEASAQAPATKGTSTPRARSDVVHRHAKTTPRGGPPAPAAAGAAEEFNSKVQNRDALPEGFEFSASKAQVQLHFVLHACLCS